MAALTSVRLTLPSTIRECFFQMALLRPEQIPATLLAWTNGERLPRGPRAVDLQAMKTPDIHELAPCLRFRGGRGSADENEH